MNDNRTTMVMDKADIRRIDQLARQQNQSRASLSNQYLREICYGKYDMMSQTKPKKERKPYIAVDKTLRRKADERAKLLGYHNANELLSRIINQ